jgi:hypothetical protein
LTLASFGPVTAFQVAFKTLMHAANANMTFLPYSVAAPVINVLLGDHVTSGLTTYSTASEQLNAGKLRSIAPPSRTRIEPLPEVPTVAECGYKGVELDYWLGDAGSREDTERKACAARRLADGCIAVTGTEGEASPPRTLSGWSVQLSLRCGPPQQYNDLPPSRSRVEH